MACNATLLQVDQQLVPALFTFTVTIEDGDQFLFALGRRTHQYEQALLAVFRPFQANCRVNAIGPEVEVLLLA